MDDKHSHIEDWLRKAAAQQAAPEDTGGELKRQSWSKMAALLDEDDAGQPAPRVSRFRFNRAAILIPFIATVVVFAATMWVAPYFSKKTAPAGKSSNVKEHPHQKNRRTLEAPVNNNGIPNDTALININNSTPQAIPADSITGFEGTMAETPKAGGVPSQIEPALPLVENKGASNTKPAGAGDKTNSTNAAGTDNSHSTTGNANSTVIGRTNVKANAVDKAAGNTNKPLGANNKPSPAGAKEKKDNVTPSLSAAASASTASDKHKKDLPHNKVNKTAIPGIANDNERVANEQTVRDKRFSSLYPVCTRNVFALQLPSLSDGSREARVPLSASGSRGLSLGASESRWGLQLGLLSPLSSALGVRVGVLYIYPLGNNWFLQPQLSASYLTGYDKAFTHVAISKQHSDTSGGGALDRYDVDTTRTPYTFKRAFAGSAGINVGYHRNKLAVSTGLVYSMAMASGKKDSSSIRSGVVRDTTDSPVQFTDPAFSPGRLPGKNQLSWNVDLSWYVTPRLQAGFNYRVVLWRSAGDKGFQAPLQRIQDNSLLELYIRIPIGK